MKRRQVEGNSSNRDPRSAKTPVKYLQTGSKDKPLGDMGKKKREEEMKEKEAGKGKEKEQKEVEENLFTGFKI